jgi:4-hydroxyphenylpyruvate dioxygenase
VALAVNNVPACFAYMVAGGGKAVLRPTTVRDDADQNRGSCMLAEVSLYGDVVIRLVDARNFTGNFLPNYQDVVAPGTKLGKYGIDRIDHVVGNVHSLQETLDYIKNMTVSLVAHCTPFSALHTVRDVTFTIRNFAGIS